MATSRGSVAKVVFSIAVIFGMLVLIQKSHRSMSYESTDWMKMGVNLMSNGNDVLINSGDSDSNRTKNDLAEVGKESSDESKILVDKQVKDSNDGLSSTTPNPSTTPRTSSLFSSIVSSSLSVRITRPTPTKSESFSTLSSNAISSTSPDNSKSTALSSAVTANISSSNKNDAALQKIKNKIWPLLINTNKGNNHIINEKQEVNETAYVVPNIVHFIWFSTNSSRDLKFVNYLSVLSAHKIQKPDHIYFHCNRLPKGPWWDRINKEVQIKIIPKEIPTQVFGQKLGHLYHAGDIAKMEVIREYGGIYIDYDVIIVKNMNPLRIYNFTLGKERPPKFIAGIVVGRGDSEFLRLWYESYRNNYRPNVWDYNCAVMAYEIYKNHTDLLHVETYKLTTPDWLERWNLWNRTIDWHDLYVVHLMIHYLDDIYNPENIKQIKSTFGEVLRYIYYDDWKVIN